MISMTTKTTKPDPADEILLKFSKGLIERRDALEETGFSWGEALLRLRQQGLTLPIVHTYGLWNKKQKALHKEIFRAPAKISKR